MSNSVWSNDIYNDGDYRRDVPRHQKTNALLVRNPLGQVRPTTYQLPQDHFVYGQVDNGDEEGAAQVINSWKQHKANPEGLPGRDFVKLNKYAAVNGCTTSKNIAVFRQQNDIRLKQGPIKSQTGNALTRPNSSSIFGRPSPASAPIDDLLNNSYQRGWIQEQRALKMASTRQRGGMRYAQSQHTRASLGHTKIRAPHPRPRFKLRQFENVRSRVAGGSTYSTLPYVNGLMSQKQIREQQAQFAQYAGQPQNTGYGGMPGAMGQQEGFQGPVTDTAYAPTAYAPQGAPPQEVAAQTWAEEQAMAVQQGDAIQNMQQVAPLPVAQ